MRPKIYLSLTDDWELRGDGSGDIERLQFHPMRELVRIYTKYGVRGTFYAEVMQQLTFRKLQGQYPELRTLADRWDAHVRETFERGHDIQLHLHPQWTGAQYDNGQWHLTGPWSLLDYDPETADAMLAAGKEYLENLLRPINAAYRCVSFRAGSLCIAPSPFMLRLLAEAGIVFDVSIVGGLRIDTRHVQIDYTNCEESFLPFYPRMEDARRVSEKPEPIVCVPVHHFYGSRHQVFRQLLSMAWRKARRSLFTARVKGDGHVADRYAQQEWTETRHASTFVRVYEKAIRPCLKGKHLTSDIGRLGYPFLCEMLRSIRRRARETGLQKVPVVLMNHSKYIEDFTPIERFLGDVSAADDIEFLTLTELAGKLRAGEFQIRKAASA